jgi:hypothetical protein
MRLDAVSVLMVTVENAKLVALIVEAVRVEATVIELVVMVLPRTAMVLINPMFMVDVIILDAAIIVAVTVLPVIVE